MNVADEIRRLEPDARITALGTVRGLDTTLIPARGYPLELIPPVPLPRRLNLALLRTPARVARGGPGGRCGAGPGAGRRGGRLRRLRRGAGLPRRPAARHPDRGARGQRPARGGQPAGGPADQRTSTPRPPRPAWRTAGRSASRCARRSSSWTATADRPAARARLGLAADRPTLLVTGGSQGARRLNEAVLGAQRALAAAGIQVLHIAGAKNPVTAPDRAAGRAAVRGAALPRRDGRRLCRRRLRAVPLGGDDLCGADRGGAAGRRTCRCRCAVASSGSTPSRSWRPVAA